MCKLQHWKIIYRIISNDQKSLFQKTINAQFNLKITKQETKGIKRVVDTPGAWSASFQMHRESQQVIEWQKLSGAKGDRDIT